ncbi:MAG: hypothetical protein JWL62_2061 [Hyphomicrobiales bacterium]|nr:hypothetical protein [Hyphomicrobiales bacterium]
MSSEQSTAPEPLQHRAKWPTLVLGKKTAQFYQSHQTESLSVGGHLSHRVIRALVDRISGSTMSRSTSLPFLNIMP